MSFRLTSINKDFERKTNKYLKIKNKILSDGSLKMQYSRVPYKFYFSLFIKTKTIDELSQIIEQIAATFDSSVHIVVNDNPDIDVETDVSIRLEEQQIDIDSGVQFELNENYSAELTFSLDGFLYKRTIESGVIKKIKIDFINNNDKTTLFETMNIDEFGNVTYTQ
jgi:hypothetical protein